MTGAPPGVLIARCTRCNTLFPAGGIGPAFEGPAAIVMPGGLRIGMPGQSVHAHSLRGWQDPAAAERTGHASGTVDIGGLTVSGCPTCGGDGVVEPGIFSFVNDAVGTLSRLTAEQAERVMRAFINPDGTPAADDAIEANIAQLPNRLRIVATRLWHGARTFGATVIATAAATLLYDHVVHPSTHLSPADIDKIAKAVIDKLAHVPPPPTPPHR